MGSSGINEMYTRLDDKGGERRGGFVVQLKKFSILADVARVLICCWLLLCSCTVLIMSLDWDHVLSIVISSSIVVFIAILFFYEAASRFMAPRDRRSLKFGTYFRVGSYVSIFIALILSLYLLFVVFVHIKGSTSPPLDFTPCPVDSE